MSDLPPDDRHDFASEPAEPFNADAAAMHGLLYVYYELEKQSPQSRAERILTHITTQELITACTGGSATARTADAPAESTEELLATAGLPVKQAPLGPMGRPGSAQPPIHVRGARRPLAWALASLVLAAGVALIWHARLRSHHDFTQLPPPPGLTTQPANAHVQFETPETRELALGDIGVMRVQGPADLELFGTTRAVLHRGRIRVRITSPAGHGFVVETPRAAVTDLGTEFGVDVASDSVTGVVVFSGSVNLAVPTGNDPARGQVERLVQGEGLFVRRTGRLDRLMAIMSDQATFQLPGEPRPDGIDPLIADVWDNISAIESNKLYEIVPHGLGEDTLAYVDRPEHEWNGVDRHGIPGYLLGADYVKTFNDYKIREDMKICVLLARPARLFVFLDRRLAPPAWLVKGFHDTGNVIGMDEGVHLDVHGKEVPRVHGRGPGDAIDARFQVWERTVPEAGIVTLGPNSGGNWRYASMYGIAAVELDPQPESSSRPD